jgi:hypothetical protein
LGLKEAILDLAYELTHFSLRLPLTLFIKFFAKEFIVSTVEGRGGEVEAFGGGCI